MLFFFFFQAEDGIRDGRVTGVQTCALPIFPPGPGERPMNNDLHLLPPGLPWPCAAAAPWRERATDGDTGRPPDVTAGGLAERDGLPSGLPSAFRGGSGSGGIGVPASCFAITEPPRRTTRRSCSSRSCSPTWSPAGTATA